MATWTKIPETKIASTLGQAAGKLAGNLSVAAGKALDKVKQKIQELEREASDVESEIRVIQTSDNVEEANVLAQQKAQEFNQKAASVLSALVSTLEAASNSLTPILKIISTLRTIIQTLKVIIPPLKIIIIVIKALPLPQRYLIVSFTILESDLLEMMEQLIKQAEEAIEAIEKVLNLLESVLKPIQDRIEAIRAELALLTVTCELVGASAEDKDVLDEAGLIDKESGDSLFEKIQDGLQGGGSTAGYGVDPDLTNPELANKLALAKEGDVISVKRNPSGSYIETWFCCSEEQPSLPAGFPQITGSWTQDPFCDPDKTWKVDLNVTGNGNIFGGLDSKPEPATEDDLKYQKQDFGTDEYLVLGKDNYDQKPGILKVDDWMDLLEDTLDKLRDLPLSQDLKDTLDSVWNKEVVKAKDGDEDATPRNLKFQWTSKSGETYTIEVVEDDHSPRVAVRRYARVTDQSGVAVLDGFKTFSTDIDSLLQEIKLQLEQLTQ